MNKLTCLILILLLAGGAALRRLHLQHRELLAAQKNAANVLLQTTQEQARILQTIESMARALQEVDRVQTKTVDVIERIVTTQLGRVPSWPSFTTNAAPR